MTTETGRLSDLIRLDPNRIEFEDVRTALRAALAEREELGAFIDADTMAFLIDAVAAVGAYAQYSIDAAWGEGNLHTARLASSIRAITRTLGVRQRRKEPASFPATFTRTGVLTSALNVPAFTRFRCGEAACFNREAFSFGENENQVSTTLHEGRVESLTRTGLDEDYARVDVGNPDFSTSDTDVRVFLDGAPVEVSTRPIWRFRNVFDEDGTRRVHHVTCSDFTTSDGACRLHFGSNLFGVRPEPNQNLRVDYAVTEGRDGRRHVVNGVEVQPTSGGFDFAGTGTGVLSGGDDEVPASTYRDAGPLVFAAQGRAIDHASYQVVPLEYPGVRDVRAIRQADYAPNDVTKANVIRMSVLTDVAITADWWTEFEKWMLLNGLATARYERTDPRTLDVTVTATVGIGPGVDGDAVKTRAEAAVRALFTPRPGLLELELHRSDLIEAITNSVGGIIWVDMSSPRRDVISSARDVSVTDLVLSIQTTVGTTAGEGGIPAGTYRYWIWAETSAGQGLPFRVLDPTDDQPFEVTFPASDVGNEVRIVSDPTNAPITRLYIARQDTSDMSIRVHRYNSLSRSIVTDDDNDSNWADLAALRTSDDTGVYYPRLAGVTITTESTDRQLLTQRRGVL